MKPINYDYEDGLRDHCCDDPLWAADEIERLRAFVKAVADDAWWQVDVPAFLREKARDVGAHADPKQTPQVNASQDGAR